MPIEDLKGTKAPATWRPSAEQQRRIQEDSRLQRMSRDDQYFFFNQKKTGGTTSGGRSAAPRSQAQSRPRSSPGKGKPSGTFFDSVMRPILDALGGANH